MTKYIFVTGGVVSGLGKGITAASLGRLLKARGLKVAAQKLDPYINVDPGTMSPYQHGEVYVTEDGAETDLDLGHYERFIDEDLNKYSNLTTGKVYWNVLNKERRGEYLGETVQVIPHITNEIKDFIYSVGSKTNADVVITEVGGTTGDIESQPFLEAIRQVGLEVGRENALYIHVTLVPYLHGSEEHKTKPTQHSVKELQGMGISPDIIVLRCDEPLEESIFRKISLFCNVKPDCVIENMTIPVLYEAPVMLEKNRFSEIVCRELHIDAPAPDMTEWDAMLESIRSRSHRVTIGLVGKYVQLHDAYLSVAEALRHAGYVYGTRVDIQWIDSETITRDNVEEVLGSCDGILVPGGFGNRGIEGKIAAREHEVRHDVMAHVLTYGACCPEAKPILHLGATSCYVGDNTDIILMREALEQIRSLLVNVIQALADFAEAHKAEPTLAYTHFQAAQPTTVGKRATLWTQDLLMDLEQLEFQLGNLKLLGCKGTTGTGASFLALFDGDEQKVVALEQKICEKMGFPGAYPVSGQTYSRKVDFQVLQVLSGIAQSASKFSSDIRLLSHLKEVDEPFESGQIGSSAMAYKRNPMRSERIASLSRYVICDLQNAAVTASAQWFERTLDDSANRRISIPEAFLATDGILTLYLNVIRGLTVYPKMAEKHLADELPFLATENILMYCVKEKGGDRQALHEAIRQHSVAAGKEVKLHGGSNDLLERILADPIFGLTRAELNKLVDPHAFTGMAVHQTETFLREQVAPVLNKYTALLGCDASVNV